MHQFGPGAFGDESDRFLDDAGICQDAAVTEAVRPMQADMIPGTGIKISMSG